MPLLKRQKELIDACEGVICDRTEFGTYEQFNSRLYEYAVSTGKIIKIPFLEEQIDTALTEVTVHTPV